MAQYWYTQWKDNRALRVGLISWEVISRAFRGKIFTREKRKGKMEDLIKLHQGVVTVLKYFLKFTKFSKYASSFVSNPRDEMNYFVRGVSDDLVEECRSVMLQRTWTFPF